jgi:hypothetical protein
MTDDTDQETLLAWADEVNLFTAPEESAQCSNDEPLPWPSQLEIEQEEKHPC